MKSIYVDLKSSALRSVDGVLYDYDMQPLLTFPARRKGDVYRIPHEVTGIAGYAFYGCQGLKSLILPDSMTKISPNAFARFTGLESIRLSETLTSLGSDAFYGCSRLKIIVIPASLKEVNGLEYCGIERIYLPEGVEAIGNNAFSDCEKLEEIILPKSVNEIKSLS